MRQSAKDKAHGASFRIIAVPQRHALCAVRSAKSAVGQQQLQLLRIGLVDDMRFSQCPLALGGFFGQDMASVRLIIDKFPGSCLFKPFGSGSICFDFRHMSLSFEDVVSGFGILAGAM